jgi:hypothetical protein
MGSKPIKEMSDRELKDEYKSLWYSIYVAEVYSVDDLVRLCTVEAELERRGYEITEKPVIRKARRP